LTLRHTLAVTKPGCHTEESRGEQRRAEESRGEQRRAEESRGEQRRAEESRGEQRRAEESRGEHNNTTLAPMRMSVLTLRSCASSSRIAEYFRRSRSCPQRHVYREGNRVTRQATQAASHRAYVLDLAQEDTVRHELDARLLPYAGGVVPTPTTARTAHAKWARQRRHQHARQGNIHTREVATATAARATAATP
jgi:hypothetical protein